MPFLKENSLRIEEMVGSGVSTPRGMSANGGHPCQVRDITTTCIGAAILDMITAQPPQLSTVSCRDH